VVFACDVLFVLLLFKPVLKTRDVATKAIQKSVPLATDFGRSYKRDRVPPDADS
jgi:hypothetical protein